MRILFYSYVFTPSFTSPAAWLERIVASRGVLEALALQHEVINLEGIGYTGQLQHNGVSYHFLPPGFSRRFPHRLHRRIAALAPDLVVVHGFHVPHALLQLRLYLKAPVLAQHHAEQPSRGWRRWLQRWAGQGLRGYFFSSPELGLPWLEAGIIRDAAKIHTVMVASSFFRAGPVAAHEPLRFLWVGRLNDNKDPLTVIRAFGRFADDHPQATLSMIFHTAERLDAVQALIGEKGWGERIRLVGPVPHAELEDWYRRARFFISGSHAESGGIAACEAMSCGCIPVLTAIPSFRWMTGEGTVGMLYPPGDEAALLCCLRALPGLDWEAERKKVLDRFAAQLSFTAIAAAMDAVFRQVQKDRGRPRRSPSPGKRPAPGAGAVARR